MGLRVVDTDQRAAGNEVMVDGELRDVSEQQRYTEVLPSLSLVLSPSDKLQVRLGPQKLCAVRASVIFLRRFASL